MDFEEFFNSLSTTFVYYDSEGVQHLRKHGYFNPAKAENADKINLKGVNHLVVEVEYNMTHPVIIQAGGYTTRRGLFVDEY